MSYQYIVELKKSAVRILGEYEEVVGAGFLVSPDRLLTCAHVVSEALDVSEEDIDTQAEEVLVSLDFPFLDSPVIQKARLISWHPSQKNGGGDIAGLELVDPPPEGSGPVSLVTAEVFYGHRFIAFGYPANIDAGVYSGGEILGPQAYGWVQIEAVKVTGRPIEPGFSGGAVWDEMLEGIAGMVVASDLSLESKVAFIIPTSVLVAACPFLEPQIRELAPEVVQKIEGVGETKQDLGRSMNIQVPADLSTADELTSLEAKLNDALDQRQEVRIKKESSWKQAGYNPSSLPKLDPDTRKLVFNNRAVEITACLNYLEANNFLVISGFDGIGKTTLARALLETLPESTPPPFWYDFSRNPDTTLGDLLDRVSGYLGEQARVDVMAFRSAANAKEPTRNQVDQLTDYLNGQPPKWLVFDNVDAALERGENIFSDAGVDTFFSGLYHNTHLAKVILTSSSVPVLRSGEPLRDELSEHGVGINRLEGLSVRGAVDVLRYSLGLYDQPDDVLVQLVEAVHGNCFALHQLIPHVRRFGAVDALKELEGGLRKATSRLDIQLKRRLSGNEYSVLESLAVLRREVKLDGIKAVGPADFDVIDRLLGEGLLESDGDGRYWLYPLVRRACLPQERERSFDAHARAVTYYKNQPVKRSPSSITQLESILEWHHHAVQAGDDLAAYAALFDTKTDDQLDRWGEFSRLASMCEQTLHEPSSLNVEQITQVLKRIGRIQRKQGEYNASLNTFQRALDLAPTHTNVEVQARLLIGLAEAYQNLKQLPQALETCEQALSLLQDKPESRALAEGMQLMGAILRDRGEYFQAVQYLQRAQPIYERLDDIVSQAYISGELGTIYHWQFDFSKALEYYLRTEEICLQIGDHHGAMVVHYNLGEIQLQLHKYEEAQANLIKAVNGALKAHASWMEVMAGLPLAETQIALGQLDEAAQRLALIEPRIEMDDDPCNIGTLLRLQALLFAKQDHLDKADEHFIKAMEVLQDPGCIYERPKAYLDYGISLADRGHIEDACRKFVEARRGYEKVNNPTGLADVDAAEARLAAKCK